MIKKLQIIIFFLLYSCIVFSQDDLSPFTPNVFEKLQFAHRGGYANGPENTLKTILASIRKGINAIEVDVEITKDNKLVLFHDEKISRVLNSDLDLKVSELSLDSLKKIPLRDTSQGVQYVCSLKELIDSLKTSIPKSKFKGFMLEIDFKPHGDKTIEGVKSLSNILNPQLNFFGDRLFNHFFISSFYPEVLKEIKKVNPKIVTSFALHNSPNSNKLLAKLAILFASKIIKKHNVQIIEPNICMINDRFVKKWRKKGVLIVTYTANTNCEKEYIEQFPIAYTTDCPNHLCESDNYGKPKKWCKNCN